MPASFPTPESLGEMPLWRLLVLLADIERDGGASSPVARIVARLVDERLRGSECKLDASNQVGGHHA
jgi:hypothetical protein